MNIAVDIGARTVRVAASAPDGTSRPVELPGDGTGDGMPLSGQAADSWQAALRETYARVGGRYGPVERLVIVVPPHTLAARAAEAAEVFAGLPGGGPAVRMLGTPVAVLALLRHHGAVPAGRHLVGDLGAREARFALCAVSQGTVAVVSSEHATVPGGLGDAFATALLERAGLSFAVSEHRQALAAAWREDGAGARLLAAAKRATSAGQEVYGSTVVLWVLGREISVRAVLDAWQPVADAMDALRERVRAAASDGASQDDREPVVLVGGLSRSVLADRWFPASTTRSRLPARTDPANAAVLGGALVAAGLVDPGDRFPHSLFVPTHGVEAGRLRSAELLVAPANALEPGGQPVFAESGGRRVRVRTAPGAARRVRIGVRASDGGTRLLGPLTLPSSPGVRYHVGVRLAADGTAHLVLRPADDAGPDTEYPLGPLPATTEGARL